MTTVTTTFDDLEEQGYPSVTDYCRFLMKLNAERYRDMPVEVYRGDMLCLIGESVEKCSKIEPTDTGFRQYQPNKNRKAL